MQQKQQAAEAADSADAQNLLDLANEELTRKELTLRDAKLKSEIFDGHHLEKRSRSELQHAQKQLTEVIKIVNGLLSSSSNGSHIWWFKS